MDLRAIWLALDSRSLAALRIIVAASGAILLAWDLRASKKPNADDHHRLRQRLFALTGILAFACWWNLGRFQFGAGYIQTNDQYHYYIGSKYAPELGYTRLYDCTAVADAEDGLRDRVLRRWMRNLETNALEHADAILANPTACIAHFSETRWQTFKHDLAWFRSRLPAAAWDQLQIDHGYNPPPVWGIAGHSLSSLAPASDRQILLLSLIDPALLVAMWSAVWWAFGWQAMCVAILWWGTNYPARFAWTGGSFLRADWLMLTVASVCLVRRKRYATAGAALGYAALLRVFPAFIAAGLMVRSLAVMRRQRDWHLAPEHARFAVGVLLAVAALLPLSFVASGGGPKTGVELWREFIANSRKHYATAATNNMGLPVLAAYAPESRLANVGEFWVETPLDSWMAARTRVFEERRLFYWLAVLAFLVVFARAAARSEDWIALALGVALLPIAAELTCYYYSILLVLGFLWVKRRAIGVSLAAAAALSNVPAGLLKMDDDVYAAVTTITVALVIVVTVMMAREPSQTLISCPSSSS